MPEKPMVPCSVYPCKNKVPAGSGGLCAEHKKTRQIGRSTRPGMSYRGYKSKWKKTRDQFLKRYPWCVVCGRPAVNVDHIIPKSQGGTDDENNLQSMCQSCHSRKTAIQSSGWGDR
ncbi:MAG: HNH endonuclease [Sphingomonadaceae bacterium]